MQEDLQAKSLEPIEDCPRSDMMFGWIEPKQDKNSSKCLVYILAIMVIQGSILLVLANIFLRARTPDFEIGSVKVRNLKYGNSSAPSFNFTLVTQVTVENTNFGEFRFDKSTGTVWCGSEVVGLMKIPKGIAQARATEKMKVSINVSSLWLSDAKNLRKNMSYGLSFALLSFFVISSSSSSLCYAQWPGMKLRSLAEPSFLGPAANFSYPHANNQSAAFTVSPSCKPMHRAPFLYINPSRRQHNINTVRFLLVFSVAACIFAAKASTFDADTRLLMDEIHVYNC
ncbi:hypothetical protein Goshw_023579 [Gossypium schwendimanii]|uniref:Late embryogenesis abundant protein LEA-2 subgroup domain-containing protein n=1 Tax=Gossypium schwendimanii TaxID=34291 RepID=A0A7J9NF96_GOSSC|nr:hypothetical protein [Gossypium schwendimanii]